MPIYEYACTTCGHRFDRLRPISRMNDEAPCPQCDGESRRQLSVFAAFSSSGAGEPRSIAGGGGCGGPCPAGCSCAMSA